MPKITKHAAPPIPPVPLDENAPAELDPTGPADPEPVADEPAQTPPPRRRTRTRAGSPVAPKD